MTDRRETPTTEPSAWQAQGEELPSELIAVASNLTSVI